LSDQSAKLLTRKLGEDVAAAERERRFIEGERRAVMSSRVVRDPTLRLEAKKQWGLRCYCCGFDYEEFYGPAGKDLAIVHHVNPLGGGNGQARVITVADVRIVCADCHQILHRQDPPLDVDKLKKRLTSRWSKWTARGVHSL
jgi:5-methylcytosine-specific restriction protein A